MKSVIPLPNQVEKREGSFCLNSAPRIVVDDASGRAVDIGRMLAEGMGYPEIEVSRQKKGATDKSSGEKRIILAVREDGVGDGFESYELEVLPDNVNVAARGLAGLFYAVQTLLQLASVGTSKGLSRRMISIPCVKIEDSPRFSWRGMMLDVSRHFFSISFLKKYVDLLARYKLNRLHLHLSDDQGWRLEIKSHPELTIHGAWRTEDGRRYGGYYTQEEMRDLVAYAARRFITIVPEIDVPGHSMAALAARPELACAGESFTPWTQAGISEDICCAGKEDTFRFFEDIFREVADVFPGSLVHIGGDEAPRTRWKDCPYCQKRIADNRLADEASLQTYFMERISDCLKSLGKSCIAWDDILDGGAPDGTTIMFWRDDTCGNIKALELGLDVIMTPTSHCYFDYKQCDDENEPGVIGVVTLKDAYEFDPAPDSLAFEQQSHVLGGQANLWTESVYTEADVEYMTLPRICALSEAVWTNPEHKNWTDFINRINTHDKFFARMGFNARSIDA